MILLWGLIALPLFFLLWFIYKRHQFQTRKQPVVAFFHPNCKDGGGGEMVLWQSLKSLQELNPSIKCIIYAGGKEGSENDIISNVRRVSGIDINTDSNRLQFVFLKRTYLLDASRYPRFTLIGQSLGSMLLGWDALNALVPSVYIDTTGCAFTYPVFRLFGGSKVACYTHYPTISADMLSMVFERRPSYNNNNAVAGSALKSLAKWIYYRLFAVAYGIVGSFSQVVMVNSNWTRNHIDSVWGAGKAQIIYPGCDTSKFQTIELNASSRKKYIISIGQFRPEKDHNLQLTAMREFLKKYPQWSGQVKLVMIGGVRNEGDQQIVDHLKKRCEDENLQDHVQFALNATAEERNKWLSDAMIGLHTMWNEHFGIGIVEMMASGVITVAHNSGGPKSDIVKPHNGQQTGFLASTASEYADRFNEILSLTSADREAIQKAARLHSKQFSNEEFRTRFGGAISGLL